MRLYTTLDKDDITQIMDQFAAGPVVEYYPFKGGSSNSNYYVATDDREYVLTVSDNKNEEEINTLVMLLKHLENHGFRTTVIVSNKKGKDVVFYQDKPILLKEYLKGEVREDLSLETLLLLGKSLAGLNKIPPLPDLPRTFPYSQEYFHEVTTLKWNHPFIPWLADRHAYIQSHLDPQLPMSLIHGDVFDNNVIVSPDGTPIIMDFEEACYYFRVFDIGMAIIGLCCDHGKVVLPKVHALLKGYRQEIALSSLELEKIKAFTVYGATATAFWRFRQFNIIAPTDHLRDHYKGMQDLADQVYQMDDRALIGG
jgi:homoserine kinase type II